MKKENTPPEEEQIVLHSILPPEEAEKPEEGFVPYCADAKSDSDRRTGRKTVTLIVLAGVLLLIPLGVYLTRLLNFYNKTLNGLSFDYRNGEETDESSAENPGEISRKLSAQMKDKTVNISAVTYSFTTDGGMYTDVAEYVFTKTGAETLLNVRTGTEKSLFAQSFTLRKNGSSTDKQKGSKWESSPDSFVPPLNDYFFETESHGNTQIECYDAYETTVGSKGYDCEIWLMQDDSGNQTEYLTLYRYFSGDTLKGVRVLSASDEIMDVYDVRSYSFT